MFQAVSEGPGAKPPTPEADPASLPGTNPTIEDPFQRHDKYFFMDGNITFLVDGTLYCVHRYFFSRDSAYFSSKFSQLDIRDHEPLRTVVSLGDTERNDFDAFLSILYPENFDEHSLSYEQWRSVLHLSTRWGFASLRKLALRSVKPPTPCDQLLLARTYGVDHWVLPALSALCERTTPISLKEARQMSVEDIVLIATVREDICNHGSSTEIPLRIEETQARISEATRDDTFPASIRWRQGGEWKPDSIVAMAVTTAPGGEGDGDTGSKTAATTSPEEDRKDGGDERLAEAAVEPPVDDKPQEVEQQIQEATSENSTNDRVEEDPRESRDGAAEKGLEMTGNPRESGDGFEADKVKLETISSEGPRIANTLSDEPEAQEQTETHVHADEPAAPSSRASSLTAPQGPEAQASSRPTPLYWRRLTARYMTMAPASS